MKKSEYPRLNFQSPFLTAYLLSHSHLHKSVQCRYSTLGKKVLLVAFFMCFPEKQVLHGVQMVKCACNRLLPCSKYIQIPHPKKNGNTNSTFINLNKINKEYFFSFAALDNTMFVYCFSQLSHLMLCCVSLINTALSYFQTDMEMWRSCD